MPASDTPSLKVEAEPPIQAQNRKSTPGEEGEISLNNSEYLVSRPGTVQPGQKSAYIVIHGENLVFSSSVDLTMAAINGCVNVNRTGLLLHQPFL